MGAYDDARRPWDCVKEMGELSMESPLKSHELLETGEIKSLWVYGLGSRYDCEAGRA